MVAVLFCSAGGTSSITWPGGKERHYKGGRIHREGGPAVVSKGTFEAWYQNGDPFRIGAGAFAQVMARAPPREKNKIADSRCAHIVMRSFHIYRQAWVRVGGISMLESFVFTFGYNPTETGVDYNAWCFVGETWGRIAGQLFATTSSSFETRGVRTSRPLTFSVGTLQLYL
jgi:hypothetical protein